MNSSGGITSTKGRNNSTGVVPRIFALIIGIDTYAVGRPLKGAVWDGKSVTKYLRNKLVPPEHITEIYNEQATRNAIIKGFNNLAMDKRIKKGDAILIFYAGHGCELEAPPGWETDGAKVQGIVPCDVTPPAARSKTVHAIPDYTIATLLNRIAANKGDNITVILDCCYASGGTRSEGDAGLRTRSIESKDLPKLPHDIDKNIRESSSEASRKSITPAGFAQSGERSHVSLTACGSREKAHEINGRGLFTSALLLVLKKLDINTLTYTELIQHIGKNDSLIKRQRPQCDGINKDRVIFRSKLVGTNQPMIQIEIQPDGALKLFAGSVQGVTPGSRFQIYQHHLVGSSNPCLATLGVATIQDYESILKLNFPIRELSSPAYALQVDVGRENDIRVYMSPALRQRLKNDMNWQAFVSGDSTFGSYSTTDKIEADMCLDITSNDRVSFQTCNKLINEHGISRLPHTTPLDVDTITNVLGSASAWNWHLRRTNEKSPLKDVLRIEMINVKQDLSRWEGDRRPIISDGNNLNTSGIVDIVADPTRLYAYQLVNNSTVDLYPYLFYFDASALIIEPYYLGPTTSTGKADCPLPKQSKMTLGYGANGRVPFAYCLEDEQQIDVGIVKLFVTNSPVEFGMLSQGSPFEGGRASVRPEQVKSILESIPYWDTISMVLVQRRA
ncbi:ICE-like protease (caspase) p20 domain protein [Ceratobasidium sp. AG-Ba]|nr:ICE-like protease (caspase) p20 domain protein [Ceratobasidium sp. AG-Ba]QRW14170.1 ICE-like protease (caspase) p20 domain protein [Ceratobasidium sp. AG-Ba]